MSDKPKFEMPDEEYGGDVSAVDAWQLLSDDPAAVLVDVRTKVEHQLIGKPVLDSLSKEPIYVEWVTMDGVNPDFVAEVEAALESAGVAKDAPVIFMCQSGGRSKIAAMQLAKQGFSRSLNLADGFEGALDEKQHRNSVDGWKVADLPWQQT